MKNTIKKAIVVISAIASIFTTNISVSANGFTANEILVDKPYLDGACYNTFNNKCITVSDDGIKHLVESAENNADVFIYNKDIPLHWAESYQWNIGNKQYTVDRIETCGADAALKILVIEVYNIDTDIITMEYIHIFRDNKGNVYKWNTSKRIDPDKEYGSTITITGVIKDHQEYNNEKQTVLTRCKIK